MSHQHLSWYDYENQAWVRNGRYVRCACSDIIDCQCYGKQHAGEPASRDTCMVCQETTYPMPR